MSHDRVSGLTAWLLLIVAGSSLALSMVAMVMMSTPEPSFLGFAAVGAGAYGWRLLSKRQSTLAS